MDRKRNIPASKLVQDYEFYPRASVDGYHVSSMAESLRAGVDLPPIIIDAKTFRVVDGFHRLRAWQRVYGTDWKVPSILREYPSDAAMYEEAMRLNSGHGRSLTMYDKVRAIKRSQELGLAQPTIAKALHLTEVRVAALIEERFSAEGEPLKYTLERFGGQQTTEAQRDFNKGPAGGMSQLFYIRQVISLLETDSMDWGKPDIVVALRRLFSLLEGKLVAAK